MRISSPTDVLNSAAPQLSPYLDLTSSLLGLIGNMQENQNNMTNYRENSVSLQNIQIENELNEALQLERLIKEKNESIKGISINE